MNGAKIGEGIGCLGVFAALGAIALVCAIVWGIYWMFTHVQINFI
jgi:hypothetical protein